MASAPFTNMRSETLNDTDMEPHAKVLTDREYWCRNKDCTKKVVSRGIPPGWFLVRKNDSSEMGELVTVSIACSALCLFQDLFNHFFGILKRV
jgi:hypothetical protein